MRERPSGGGRETGRRTAATKAGSTAGSEAGRRAGGGLRLVIAEELPGVLAGTEAPASGSGAGGSDALARRSVGGGRAAGDGGTQKERKAARRADREAIEATRAAADPMEAARQACLRELAHGPRTRAELAAVLRREEVAAEVAEAVLERFTEAGVVDDALFAQMWVSSRHRARGLSSGALRQELRRKGVEEEVVAEAVAEIDPDEELATAHRLIERKLRATQGLDPDVRVRRLAGVLARKGFPAGTAFRVVREALAEEGVDRAHLPDLPDA